MLVVDPVTAPGCPGIPVETVLHLGTLLPHALVADMHTLMLVNDVGKFAVIDGVLAPDAMVAVPAVQL